MQNAWAWGSEPPQTVMVPAAAAAHYTPRDLLAMLWRERWLMAGVFAGVSVLGLVGALQLKPSYAAHSSLLVRLSPEYVYNPRVGDAARGLAPESDQVVQSESQILMSAQLAERVISDIGLGRLYPTLAKPYASADPAKRKHLESLAVKTLDASLKVATAPSDSVIGLTYANPDPQMAATVLNTLVDEYLRFRTRVLASHDTGAIDQEREGFQDQLDQVNTALGKFLADNDIGDFDTEKAAMGQVYAQLLTDSYNVSAQLGEADGRLGATEQEFGHTPAETLMSHDLDHTASDKLLALRLNRQDLLSRYTPGAQPVQDVDRQIADLEALSSSGGAAGAGAKRIGANPVFQTLQTERNQLQAEAASLRARKGVLSGELAQLDARRQKLNQLQPQYDDLVRQRDVLAANVKALIQREQESQAQSSLASEQGDGNVQVIERAITPATGSSLKAPVMALAVLFAAFTALCAGLLRAFARRGAPSADYVERAVGLPVLATTGVKPARA
jgi:uncharacterized protein involved in exopolysaccharide biosynthesis